MVSSVPCISAGCRSWWHCLRNGWIPIGHATPFAVMTHGGGGEAMALRQLDRILQKRNGRWGSMPLWRFHARQLHPDTNPLPRNKRSLPWADREIAVLAGQSRGGKRELPSSLIPRILHAFLYPWFASRAHDSDKNFTVSDRARPAGSAWRSARRTTSGWQTEDRLPAPLRAPAASFASTPARGRQSMPGQRQRTARASNPISRQPSHTAKEGMS